MSYLNQIHLNKDIAVLKSIYKDIEMEIKNYDNRFKYIMKLNKTLKLKRKIGG